MLPVCHDHNSTALEKGIVVGIRELYNKLITSPPPNSQGVKFQLADFYDFLTTNFVTNEANAKYNRALERRRRKLLLIQQEKLMLEEMRKQFQENPEATFKEEENNSTNNNNNNNTEDIVFIDDETDNDAVNRLLNDPTEHEKADRISYAIRRFYEIDGTHLSSQGSELLGSFLWRSVSKAMKEEENYK